MTSLTNLGGSSGNFRLDDYLTITSTYVFGMMFGGQLQNCVTSLKEMGHDWTQSSSNSWRRTLSTANECLLMAESSRRRRESWELPRAVETPRVLSTEATAVELPRVFLRLEFEVDLAPMAAGLHCHEDL